MSENDDDNSETVVNYSQYNDHCVPHIPQKSSWDCGLASVAMAVRGVGRDCTLEELKEQCTVKSIWTIDLAFLLRNFVLDFTYYTSFLGSRKEYQNAKFYKEAFNDDEKRVNKLFTTAKSCSIHVVRMKLPLDDFKRFLYCKKFAIIVLVNARLLSCQLCIERQSCLATTCYRFELLLERIKGYDYVGHYIVLIGYDPTEDSFIYRDPAVQDPICTVYADVFDRARQSEGTDNDCIVVKL